MVLAKAELENNKLKHELQIDLMNHFLEVDKLVMQARKEQYLELASELQKIGQQAALSMIENTKILSEQHNEMTEKIENMYNQFNQNQLTLLNERLKPIESIHQKLLSMNEIDPGYEIYKKSHEKLLLIILQQYEQAEIDLRSQKSKLIESNIHSNQELKQILERIQISFTEIIGKSVDLIGNTNTAQTLINRQENDNTNKQIENNSQKSQSEEVIVNEEQNS